MVILSPLKILKTIFILWTVVWILIIFIKKRVGVYSPFHLYYNHPLFTKRMRKKELLKKLREYQSWRKGADTPMIQPSELTRIIDSAITVIEKSDTSKVNAVLFRKEVIDKLHITVGAMILDGYDELDSCVKYVNDLIRELDEN